jgi:hypothetical protein
MKSNKIIVFTAIFIVFVFSCFGQDKPIPIPNSSNTEAEKVIQNYKNTISKKVKIEDIKNLSLEFAESNEIISKEGKTQTESETKLFFSIFDKMRLERFSYYTNNQGLTTEIYDGSKIFVNSEVYKDGSPFQFGSNIASVAPKLTKEKRISLLQNKVFLIYFPITLQYKWFEDLQFKYVGEVESKEGKMDVIETTNKFNTKIQLFFDKKTKLLILVSEKWISEKTKKEAERKSYFSDYKEVSGLLVAHKILIQTGESMTDVKKLTKFEINPIFKANTFEIKEEKINPF